MNYMRGIRERIGRKVRPIERVLLRELERVKDAATFAATPRRLAVDRVFVRSGCLIVSGWVEGGSPPRLVDGSGQRRSVSVETAGRGDVAELLKTKKRITGYRFATLLRDGADDIRTFAVTHGRSRVPLGARLGESAAQPEERRFGSLLERFIADFTPDKASVLEIGSRARSGNTYRHLFPDYARYTGIDVTAGPNVDIVGDAHHLSRFVEAGVDRIFSVSVFEHLMMPWKVAVEMSRVLKPGGLAYIQSHTSWPLHDEPWDFFRFSREAWTSLFNAATGFEVVDTAYSLEASIVPHLENAAALKGISDQRTFLLSACLVRKIGEPTVDWACEAGSLNDLAYTHGSGG